MKTVTIMDTKCSTALPDNINKLVSDINKIFENSKHRLVVLAPNQKELDLIVNDFGHMPFMDLRLLKGSLSESSNTRQMYRDLKGSTVVPAHYWEKELKVELDDFRSTIEGLESLSVLYRQYLSDATLGYRPELVFVLSKPASPLMVIYSGTKAMMYNFSGQA